MLKMIGKALLSVIVVLGLAVVGLFGTIQAQCPPEEGSCVAAPFEFDDHDEADFF